MRSSRELRLLRLPLNNGKRKDSRRNKDWQILLNNKESKKKKRGRDLRRKELLMLPGKLNWKPSLRRLQLTRPSRRRLPIREG